MGELLGGHGLRSPSAGFGTLPTSSSCRLPMAAGKILREGVGIAQLWQRPYIWCDAFSTNWMPSWAVK